MANSINVRGTISNFFQFIFGFVIGVLILAGGTALLGFYFFSKMSSTPEKPIFTEELPKEETKTAQSNTNSTNSGEAKSTQVQSSTSDFSNPFVEGETTNKPEGEELEAGAYKARVTWERGLILRDEPTTQASRIGGVGYNWEIVILKESNDGRWQKVRIPSSGQTGWVKAGNVQRID